MVRLSGPSPRLPDEPLRTDRLLLPVVDRALAADMLAGRRRPGWAPGFPREDDCDGVAMIAREPGPGEPVPDLSWGSRLIVRRVGDLTVGTIGFFGPPGPATDGVLEAEIGYGLVAEARGHGAASEALRRLLVETDRVGVRVRAAVVPENRASLRVLAHCGFTDLRGTDEDGQLVLARPVPR